MKKAIQYCRVSSEGQVENTSIQDQQEKIKNYSKTYDIEIVAQFSDISSGGNTEREGYQNLKEYIKENKIDCIIVYKLDRLHRSLKNLLQDKEEFEEQGISIISVIEQMDTSTAQGKLFFNIIGSFSEFEKDLINTRTQAGKAIKIKNGQFTAGKIPYGYEIEKSEYLIINDKQAETVKQIYKLYLADNSIRAIAGTVEIPKSTVAYILKNEAYIGKLQQEKESYIDIPQIIAKRTFTMVQTKLNKNNKRG